MNIKRTLIVTVIISMVIIFLIIIGGVLFNFFTEQKFSITDETIASTMNTDYKSTMETAAVVQVSSDLIFELPTDVENFTETQYTELEDFLYEEGWDTISAYYMGIYGENSRKVVSEIQLEPVKTETVTTTEWDDFVDENGDTIVEEFHTYSFVTTISYLLYSSKDYITTTRLTIIYSAPIINGAINYNAIGGSYIANADESLNNDCYTLVKSWQGDVKLYKRDGFILGDEYFDVHTGSWGSDNEDFENGKGVIERGQEDFEQDQKEYWPASANSSWDNLLDIGAQFNCDAETDVWYALIGDRVCYWIPTEKEWMTEYDLLFETYYLTSTDGIKYKLYKMIDGERTWQLGFDRMLTADGSLVVN